MSTNSELHSLRTGRVVAEFTGHWPSAHPDPDRPYKTVCVCGRAAYVFSTHLAEVAVETIEAAENALVVRPQVAD